MHPMKRVGKKGEGKWEKISWDQALKEIAAKLTEIKEKFGKNSILRAIDLLPEATGQDRNKKIGGHKSGE